MLLIKRKLLMMPIFISIRNELNFSFRNKDRENKEEIDEWVSALDGSGSMFNYCRMKKFRFLKILSTLELSPFTRTIMCVHVKNHLKSQIMHMLMWDTRDICDCIIRSQRTIMKRNWMSYVDAYRQNLYSPLMWHFYRMRWFWMGCRIGIEMARWHMYITYRDVFIQLCVLFSKFRT